MSESASALYSTICTLTRQTWRSKASRRPVNRAGGRRLLIAATVVARGRRLTRLRCGSLSVFNDHNSLPQATRALAFGTASVIETAQPSAQAKAKKRKVLVRGRRRASKFNLLDYNS